MSMSARGLLSLIACAAMTAAPAAYAQSIIYVDDDAPGGAGDSWANAHNSLHAALAAAVSGDEVRVAAGVYRPAGPGGDRNLTFTLPEGVRLMGGYAGVTSATPDDRDPALYVTTLSGDLNGDDAPGFVNIGENAHHVVVTGGFPGPSTRLDGLVIAGGNATGSFNRNGAGLYIGAGSPTVASCAFTGNSADSTFAAGGAVCSFGTAPAFIDCVFTGNRSEFPFSIAHGYGGAIYIQGGSFTNCTFTNNSANEGGAIYVGDNVTMTGCTISGNNAVYGGGIYRGGSGNFVIDGCSFNQNTASEGAGINLFVPFGNVAISRSNFVGNAASRYGGALLNFYQGNVASRCVFAGNSATLGGGAIGSGSGAGLLLNCTIVGNTTAATGGGGVLLTASDSTVDVRNCILWDNSAAGGTGQEAQIERFFVTGSFPIVNYSCVMGLTLALGGDGNIGLDPMFVDPGLGDYSLLGGSPCINAGDPSPIYNDVDGTRNDMGAIVGAQNTAPTAVAVCQQLTSIGQTAMVRLDASGSSDTETAAADLSYEWLVDGSPACTGSYAGCVTIDVPMSFGEHTVTLRVTDAGGLVDEDVKVITLDPASLALLGATKVDVDFGSGEFSFEGEIALPSTLSYTELQRTIVASASVGGVTAVPAAQYGLSAGGPGGSKWAFSGPATVGALSRLDVDWGGARFLYRPPGFPVRLQSDTITSTESVLEMSFNYRRTGAFTMTVGDGAIISVAANGAITSNVPYTSRANEVTLTLPFPLGASTTFAFTGSVAGSFGASDHLTYSVGRFRAAGHFEPALCPDGSSTTPRTIELTLEVGAEGYPGTATAGPGGVTVRPNAWRFR